MRRHAVVDTPLGDLWIAADGSALTHVLLDGQRYFPDLADLGERVDVDEDEVLTAAQTQLTAYFFGTLRTFDLRLAPRGEDFAQQVWVRLLTIPYGGRTTYGDLAREMGDVALAQAVGQAVGHNPLSIVIPCHRVVGVDGAITGYAGGVDRKRALLALEEPSAEDGGRLF